MFLGCCILLIVDLIAAAVMAWAWSRDEAKGDDDAHNRTQNRKYKAYHFKCLFKIAFCRFFKCTIAGIGCGTLIGSFIEWLL